jgi:hypothetical protein
MKEWTTKGTGISSLALSRHKGPYVCRTHWQNATFMVLVRFVEAILGRNLFPKTNIYMKNRLSSLWDIIRRPVSNNSFERWNQNKDTCHLTCSEIMFLLSFNIKTTFAFHHMIFYSELFLLYLLLRYGGIYVESSCLFRPVTRQRGPHCMPSGAVKSLIMPDWIYSHG